MKPLFYLLTAAAHPFGLYVVVPLYMEHCYVVTGSDGAGRAMAAGFAELFANRWAIICPDDAVDSRALDRLVGALGDPAGVDYRQLLRRLSMQTSARNQFVGAITGLREGEVSFEVRLRLDDETLAVLSMVAPVAAVLARTVMTNVAVSPDADVARVKSTVDEPADVELCVRLGVDAIITNRPAAVLSALGRTPAR